jgi:hypothetical protein
MSGPDRLVTTPRGKRPAIMCCHTSSHFLVHINKTDHLPLASATPWQMPLPLPRRLTLSITCSTTSILAIFATSARVPSLPLTAMLLESTLLRCALLSRSFLHCGKLTKSCQSKRDAILVPKKGYDRSHYRMAARRLRCLPSSELGELLDLDSASHIPTELVYHRWQRDKLWLQA